MTVKHIKSNEARRDWADVLQHVRQGGTVVVEHYNRPIADITPHGETSMEITEVTADVPADCSRATAAVAWRAVAINLGFEVEVVGKDNEGNPLIKRGGDPFDIPDSGSLYVLMQDDAVIRAERYNTPSSIDTYEEPEPIWNDCPADNCDHGDVSLSEFRDEDGSVLMAGACGFCSTESVQCPNCEALTPLFDGDETPCETGCGAVFQKELGRKGETAGFRRIR